MKESIGKEGVPEPMITIALIEDSRLLREGLATTLNAAVDLEVIHSGSPPLDVGRLRMLGPCVVLLESRLPGDEGLLIARTLHKDLPEGRVLILHRPAEAVVITRFTRAGVSGFLHPEATFRELLEAIRSAASANYSPWIASPAPKNRSHRGRRPGRTAMGGTLSGPDGRTLTPREWQVAELIADGLSNQAIGDRLGVSPHTVKSHVRNIMSKWEVGSRVQIAVRL